MIAKQTADRIAALANRAASHRSQISTIRSSRPPIENWMGEDARRAAEGANVLEQARAIEKAESDFRSTAWSAAHATVAEWRLAEGKASTNVKSKAKAARKAIDPSDSDQARLDIREALDTREGQGYGATVLELFKRYADRDDAAALKALRQETRQALTGMIGQEGTDAALASQARHHLATLTLPGEAELASAEAELESIRAMEADLANAVREVAREAGGNPVGWVSELGLTITPVEASTDNPASPTITATSSGAVIEGSWA